MDNNHYNDNKVGRIAEKSDECTAILESRTEPNDSHPTVEFLEETDRDLQSKDITKPPNREVSINSRLQEDYKDPFYLRWGIMPKMF